MDTAGGVTIVAPARSSLGVALEAALAAKGWSTSLSAGSAGQLVSGTAEYPYAAVLIVVEDDEGSAHPPAASTGSTTLICVGSVNSLSLLISFASRGATVLNQDAPFPALMRAVENALFATQDRTVGDQVETLLRRQGEAVALASLTAAEEDALHGLMTGLTATQMATRSHRSINTVRSQIKAVLAKLGVQTQLTAVAIAHRSGRWDRLDQRLAHFHQFW